MNISSLTTLNGKPIIEDAHDAPLEAQGAYADKIGDIERVEIAFDGDYHHFKDYGGQATMLIEGQHAILGLRVEDRDTAWCILGNCGIVRREWVLHRTAMCFLRDEYGQWGVVVFR